MIKLSYFNGVPVVMMYAKQSALYCHSHVAILYDWEEESSFVYVSLAKDDLILFFLRQRIVYLLHFVASSDHFLAELKKIRPVNCKAESI